MNKLLILFCSISLFSCASLRNKMIITPQDIDEKGRVEKIPDIQQNGDKVISVTRSKAEGPKDKVITGADPSAAQDVAVGLAMPVKLPVVPKDDKEIHVKKDKVKEKEKEKTNSPIDEIKIVKTVETIRNPFKINEVITMEIEYLGLTAAKMIMETQPLVLFNGRKSFHFKATLLTSTLMNIIYRANDTLDLYVDYTDFIPRRLDVQLNESRQNMKQIVIYDHDAKKAFFWKKRIDKNDNVTEIRRADDFIPFAMDVPTMIYFIRTKDLKVGDKLDYIVYDNGKLWELTVDVLRTELIKTAIGKIDTFVLKPTLKLSGQIQNKGELLLWITNDDRKIPVKFKAKAKIGSVTGEITELVRE